jgi:tetratricopeptide (TPR) repeat protein
VGNVTRCMAKRDGFPRSVVETLAKRTSYRCSNPTCRRPTSGPDESNNGVMNIGVAAHIAAASLGGPRFDKAMSTAQRKSVENGIWLCQSCAKLVDSDTRVFTVAVLAEWKAEADRVAKGEILAPPALSPDTAPTLLLPATDPSRAFFPFSARATELAGRERENTLLDAFLDSSAQFSWWLVTGPAGSGKSRLALELCRRAQPTWIAGFLSRVSVFDRWTEYRPAMPTLIVVDYVAGRVSAVSDMVLQLGRSVSNRSKRVRVLLVEREENRPWRATFLREDSHSESIEIASLQYGESLRLGALQTDALHAMAADVAAALSATWSAERQQAFDQRLAVLDASGRPLFAMIAAADVISDGQDRSLGKTIITATLSRERARWRQVAKNESSARKTENLIVLATLIGGIGPRRDGFSFLAQTAVSQLLPEMDLFDDAGFRELVGASADEALLAGLQPDVLGERFVLNQMVETGNSGLVARRLLAEAWTLQPDSLRDFILRAATDFYEDEGIELLLAQPSGSHSLMHWAKLAVGVIDLARRSSDVRAIRLRESLRKLANQPGADPELLQLLAQAEFHFGNIYLMLERDRVRAAAQFARALEIAGEGTEVAGSALNNRGILFMNAGEVDRAFADWSTVAGTAGYSDEAKACALNNRADVFDRRGAFEEAIADRSAVLALVETSYNRRFIALIRRSRALEATGNTKEALRDLGTILQTDDISSQQKAEARFSRAMLLKRLARAKDARAELLVLVGSALLFPGTRADALIELARLRHGEGELVAALNDVGAALALPDILERSALEGLVARGGILAALGKHSAAASDFAEVLEHELALPEHRKAAEEGLDALRT